MKKLNFISILLIIMLFSPLYGEVNSKININTSSLNEMCHSGIKKGIALKIIAFRKLIGPLKSEKDIKAIKGVGKSTLNSLMKIVNFGNKKDVKLYETSYVLEDIIRKRKIIDYKKNFKVNINTASPDELSILPGVREGMAKRIINDRVKNGAYKKIEDLKRVYGISNKKYKKIEKYIEVGDGKSVKGMKDFKDADIKKMLSSKNSSTLKKSFVGDGKLHIYMIDVDQGDSLFIVTPEGYTILIDAGENRWCKKSVIPFLKKMGIKRINHLVVSHAHIDHIGGVVRVLKTFKVDRIYDSGYPSSTLTYRNFLKMVQRLGIPYNLGRDGSKLEVDKNIKFYFLHPDKNVLSFGTRSDANVNSSVLKLEYGNFSMLFTGDIEAESERRLVKLHKKEIASTILKAPHHGGAFSSTMPFLKAVSPKIVLISVGYKNMFGHPNPKTIAKYNKIGAKIYRTDNSGTISVESDGKSFSIEEEYKNGSKSHKNSQKKENVIKERVNINSADLKQLCKIPLIGKKTAKKIIKYREIHGFFTSPDEITKVRGIGKKLFKRIKKYIFVK